MVPLGKAPKTEGQVRLTAVQLEESNKKKGTTFVATITSSNKDNGTKKSLPPGMKKLPRQNNVVTQKKSSRRLPPTKEVDHEAELEKINKQLKELVKGIDRVNGLLVARTRRQDSITDKVTMQRGRRINRWWRMSRPATFQLYFASEKRRKVLELWRGLRKNLEPSRSIKKVRELE